MSSTRTVTRTLPAWLTLLGIVLLALNLRASIAALSPLIDEVRADLDLTRGQAGLLTSLPVLCFGLLSPLAPLLGRRVGLELSLLLVMLGVVAGSLVRTAPGVAAMVAGTVLIGAAVTVGNVLVPSVVKQDFAQSDGLVTGLYTAALTGGAALSAALSAPLADGVGLGWRGSLLVWGGLALVAALVWLPQLQVRHVAGADRGSPGAVLRSPQTWWLAGFMAMQALSFYALLAWLPDLLEDEGVSAVGAGWALSLFNLLGIVSALVVPTLAGRRPDQRLLVLITCGTWLVALVGLGAAPSWWPLWSVLAGLAQGSGSASP